MKSSLVALTLSAVAGVSARALGYRSPSEFIRQDKRGALQDIVSFLLFFLIVFEQRIGKIGKGVGKRRAKADGQQVTWDKDTIFVNGERLFLYSGEVHPFRYVIQHSSTLRYPPKKHKPKFQH